MTTPSTEAPAPTFVIERVVIALDAVSDNRVALQRAAGLARRWGVGLHGLFLVDPNLERLCGLPGVREVSLAATAGPVAPGAIEASIDLLERRARRALASAAAGAPSGFSVARGGFAAAISFTATDLLVVEGSTRAFGVRIATRSRWRATIGAQPSSILELRGRAAMPGPVACLYDAGPAAGRALAAAIRLAEDGDAALAVCVAASAPDDAEAVLERLFAAARRPPRILRLAPGEAARTRLLAALRPALVVAPAALAEAVAGAGLDIDLLAVP